MKEKANLPPLQKTKDQKCLIEALDSFASNQNPSFNKRRLSGSLILRSIELFSKELNIGQ